MEKHEAYSFTNEEIHVLAEALAMYAAYQKVCVLPMLMGDESDLEEVTSEANAAMDLAYNFIEEDSGEKFEELSNTFQERHDRPMDMSDVSDFDWFEYMQGELNQ